MVGGTVAKSAGSKRSASLAEARHWGVMESTMTKAMKNSGGGDPSEVNEHAPRATTHAGAWVNSWGRTASASASGEGTPSSDGVHVRARKRVHDHAAHIHDDC